MDKLINQVVVSVNLRRQILSEYHDLLVGGGHQGFDRHAKKSSLRNKLILEQENAQ